VAIAGVYLAFVAVSAISAARTAGDVRDAPAVAAAIVTMHVSWGLGFWRGLLAPGSARSVDTVGAERQTT
jgi:hypothetical protein